jgi:acylphosphatase
LPAIHLKIAGHVQGVGFRYGMCKEARSLRLAGWVRNCRDGSVEAVAEGDDHSLQRLVEWARHGPAGAQVDTVEVNPANAAQTIDLNVPFAQRSSV